MASLKDADARAVARTLSGRLEELSKELGLLILKTPSSPARNGLADANIHILTASTSLDRLGRKE